VGFHEEGLRSQQIDSREIVERSILPDLRRQDRRDGEYDQPCAGSENSGVSGNKLGGGIPIKGWEDSEVRTAGKPTRLEIHRLKWNQNGRRGPMLAYASLDDLEKELVQKELLQDIRVKRIDFTGDMDEQIYDQVYLEVLNEWGVTCPHPTSALKRSTFSLFCSTCGCDIVVPGMAKLTKKVSRAVE
jgi:hypothetical protein